MASLRSSRTLAEAFRRFLPTGTHRGSLVDIEPFGLLSKEKQQARTRVEEQPLHGQIQIRPFRSSDAQQVRGLFASSVIGRDAGLFIEDMRMADPMDTQKPSLAAIARSIYRFPLMCMFAAQVGKLTKEGDLADISKAFGIEESPVTRCSRLTGKNGFWAAEWSPTHDTDRDGGTENRLVGCVGLAQFPVALNANPTTTVEHTNASELRRMVVSPEFRRRGVARRLLQAAVQHARTHSIKQIRLTTSSQDEKILKLYAKLGYQLKAHHRPSGILDTLHVFELILDVDNFNEEP
ncbi:acyl-CoA N-acyltransferase [Agrocybe pediades]|nr:acyl-CoA N-acyltransferase [Agrocybe pediades]